MVGSAVRRVAPKQGPRQVGHGETRSRLEKERLERISDPLRRTSHPALDQWGADRGLYRAGRVDPAGGQRRRSNSQWSKGGSLVQGHRHRRVEDGKVTRRRPREGEAPAGPPSLKETSIGLLGGPSFGYVTGMSWHKQQR